MDKQKRHPNRIFIHEDTAIKVITDCRIDEQKRHPNRIFIHEDTAIKVIMDCRIDESCGFKKRTSIIKHVDILFKV